MNINAKQLLAIAIAVISVWAGAAAQLDVLLGPTASKVVVSLSSLTVASLAAALGVLSGQGATVKEVLAMPGVQKISVNEKANQTLAALAVDPAVDKIAPTPAAVDKVEATAKGA